MNFFKNHTALRLVIMTVLFVAGLALTYYGWTLTGQLKGLYIMLLGLVFLLATLFVYNKAHS